MMRARSCWCSGTSAWIKGTVCAQTRRKDTNAGGQLDSDKSIGPEEDLEERGSGTDGGSVVLLRAAK